MPVELKEIKVSDAQVAYDEGNKLTIVLAFIPNPKYPSELQRHLYVGKGIYPEKNIVRLDQKSTYLDTQNLTYQGVLPAKA